MQERIGWGLIGASNIARMRVAGAIRDSAAGRLIAIASHDLELAQAFAREFNIPHAHGALEPLLADSGVGAVYVSSTNQHHPAQVLAAAAAGRHVLCEKPLALTLEAAVAMARACREAGVVLATNHHLRNAVTLRAMQAEVSRGAIGTPLTAFASQPAWVADSDWRRTHPAAGAGVCFDVLVHTADAVRFVLGREPVEACALGASSPAMAEGIYDLIMATYRFEGGALAQLHADFHSPHGRSRLEVHGTEGSLVGTDVLGKNPAHRGRVVRRTKSREEEVALESDDSRYLRGIELFHAAVRGEGAPACSGADGIRSLAMILAAEQAAASGRTCPVSRAGLEFL